MAPVGGADRGAGRAVLTYNLYRLGLLAICLGIGWAARLPFLIVIVAASLVSGVLSWFLLRRQREAAGRAVERTVARGQAKLAARTAAEDGYVDSVLGGQDPSAQSPDPAGAAATHRDPPAP